MARNPDIRVPMMMATVFRPVPANRMQSSRHRWLTVLARRKPEVTVAQAQASLDILYHQVLAAELQELGSTVNAHDKERALASRIQLAPGNQGFAHLRRRNGAPAASDVQRYRYCAAIACANLANLLLARNAKRKQEISIRLAIGAGRGRLIRQWLTESLLLAALGGCAGIVVAYWAKTAMLGFLPANFSANLHAPMDLRVLGFALLASLVTGLLFGLAPALQLSQSGVSLALRAMLLRSPRVSASSVCAARLFFSRWRSRCRYLIGAGLFLHSLRNLRGVNTGFVKGERFSGDA